MKVYKCDACEATIENPYDVRMKEFYIGMDFDYGMAFPCGAVRRTKVHLCDDCFKSLKDIATKRRES